VKQLEVKRDSLRQREQVLEDGVKKIIKDSYGTFRRSYSNSGIVAYQTAVEDIEKKFKQLLNRHTTNKEKEIS